MSALGPGFSNYHLTFNPHHPKMAEIPADLSCSHCGKTGKNFPRCGRCSLAYYCNATCQTQAWPSHKAQCKKNRKEKKKKEKEKKGQTQTSTAAITPSSLVKNLLPQSTFLPQPEHIELPSNLLKGDLWELKESPGKGLGLFALQVIAWALRRLFFVSVVFSVS